MSIKQANVPIKTGSNNFQVKVLSVMSTPSYLNNDLLGTNAQLILDCLLLYNHPNMAREYLECFRISCQSCFSLASKEMPFTLTVPGHPMPVPTELSLPCLTAKDQFPFHDLFLVLFNTEISIIPENISDKFKHCRLLA